MSSLACSPAQDAACGLTYASQVLERGGLPDALTVDEAPRLVQAAGSPLVSHAILQAQVDDAARVVAAADPASAPVVQRVRASMAALVEPPKEPISNQLLNGVAILGSILGVVLGILPAFGILVSPWLVLGVLGVSLAAYGAQLFNNSAITRTQVRRAAEHEEAILALLRRADALRAQMAQQARQTAHLSLDTPAMLAPGQVPAAVPVQMPAPVPVQMPPLQ